MLIAPLVTSLLMNASPVPDSQHYLLQTSRSATQVEVVVPFQKVITMQSYILRVCPNSQLSTTTVLSAKLDDRLGSSLAAGNGCQIIDFPISLTNGKHTVTISAGENDSASYTFEVVPGERLDFGTVSSGRYQDWSILRSKRTIDGDYVLCSLSLATPKDATLVAPETGDVLNNVTIQQRPDDFSCFDISGAYAEIGGIYELQIRLSSGRSIVFPIDNSDSRIRE